MPVLELTVARTIAGHNRMRLSSYLRVANSPVHTKATSREQRISFARYASSSARTASTTPAP